MGGVKHVAIAGNMGVGKSTLTAALAERLGARPHYESVDDHPYLERYYEDMPRWAFQSQFFFLSQAFEQHCDILASDELNVQDRTIYEHFHVFVTSLHEQGILGSDDFGVLSRHYAALEAVVPGPDLMVYLRASVPTLQRRMRVRDRNCESSVSVEYLEGLERHYQHWMSTYNASEVLIVDTDDLDIHNFEHRELLMRKIERRLAARATTFAVAQRAV